MTYQDAGASDFRWRTYMTIRRSVCGCIGSPC